MLHEGTGAYRQRRRGQSKSKGTWSYPRGEELGTDPTRTALIVIDASARRQEESSRYHRGCRQLEQTSAKLKDFEQEELPAFQRWFEREMAEPIALMRKLQIELEALCNLVAEIESYADLKGISYRQAHQAIQSAREAGRLEELWAEAIRFTQAEADTSDDFSDDHSDHHSDDSWTAGHDSPYEDAHEPRPRKFASASQDSGPDYAKALYRRLVRLLHPDIHPEGGSPLLWAQLQEAYAWRDIAAMERLLRTLTNRNTDSLDMHAMPIGDIVALRRDVEARLRRMRKSLRQAKSHPGWDFSKWCKNRVKVQATRAGLSAAISMDLQVIRSEMSQVQRQLDFMVGSSADKRSKNKRGRSRY